MRTQRSNFPQQAFLAIFVFVATAGWTWTSLGTASSTSSLFIPGVERSLALLQQVCRSKDSDQLRRIATATKEASMQFALSEELLFAMMSVESRCLVDARSHRGAIGLMQLMPATAKELGFEDATKLRSNVFGGAKYMSLMMHKFNGDVSKAIAAYNAGPAAVRRHKGKVPYKETRNYVTGVMSKYEALKKFPVMESKV